MKSVPVRVADCKQFRVTDPGPLGPPVFFCFYFRYEYIVQIIEKRSLGKHIIRFSGLSCRIDTSSSARGRLTGHCFGRTVILNDPWNESRCQCVIVAVSRKSRSGFCCSRFVSDRQWFEFCLNWSVFECRYFVNLWVGFNQVMRTVCYLRFHKPRNRDQFIIII